MVPPSWLAQGEMRQAADTEGLSLLVFSPVDQISRLLDNAGKPPKNPVFQVVPLEIPITPDHFGNWRSYLPEAAREGDRFLLDNGVVRGTGPYRHLSVGPVIRPEGWPKRPYLVVDAGFFVSLYKDEVRTPMVRLAIKLYATLREAGIDPAAVRIVNRNRELDFPLEFGYLPRLLREIFSAPDSFGEDLPPHWARLDHAQYMTVFGQPDEAVEELGALSAGGGAPYALYQVAVVAFRQGEVEAGIERLREAAREDPDYARGFLVQAARYWQREETEAAEAILRAGREIFPGDERIATGIARLLVERAYRGNPEDPEASRKLFEEAVSLPIPAEVRKEIVAIWAESGAFDGPAAPRKP